MNRVGSPNLDVGYYFYNSLKPQVRRRHITALLRIYYDELKMRAKELKTAVDFSFQVCNKIEMFALKQKLLYEKQRFDKY